MMPNKTVTTTTVTEVIEITINGKTIEQIKKMSLAERVKLIPKANRLSVKEYMLPENVLTENFANYRTINKTSEEYKELRALIINEGSINDKIKLDAKKNNFSGFHRIVIGIELGLPIPFKVYPDIDMSTMKEPERLALMYSNNKRVQDKKSDIKNLVWRFYECELSREEISRLTGISVKQVGVYISIDESVPAINDMFNMNVSLNNVQKYQKSIDNSPSLKQDKEYTSLFFKFDGKDLDKEVKKFNSTKQLEKLTSLNVAKEYIHVSRPIANRFIEKQGDIVDIKEVLSNILGTLENDNPLYAPLVSVCDIFDYLYFNTVEDIEGGRSDHLNAETQRAIDEQKEYIKLHDKKAAKVFYGDAYCVPENSKK